MKEALKMLNDGALIQILKELNKTLKLLPFMFIPDVEKFQKLLFPGCEET